MERYVFFNDVDSAKKLYALVKDAGIKCTIAPTPRTESKVCGISILYWEASDTEKIQDLIKENAIDIDRFYVKTQKNDPNRMRFC